MGLDYFTVDTDLDADPKIQNLIRKGDADAWTVYSWLWIKTYHDNYYIEKETLVQCILWLFRGLDEERILECLDMLVDCKLIDRTLYEKGIITGKGIQKRYWEVAKKRSVLPDMTYWLLNDVEFSEAKTTEEVRFDDGKPHGGVVSEAKKHEREREREREKEKEIIGGNGKAKFAVGGASDFKKPPTYGLPKKDCELCGGTGFIFKKDGDKDVTVYCDCRKEG